MHIAGDGIPSEQAPEVAELSKASCGKLRYHHGLHVRLKYEDGIIRQMKWHFSPSSFKSLATLGHGMANVPRRLSVAQVGDAGQTFQSVRFGQVFTAKYSLACDSCVSVATGNPSSTNAAQLLALKVEESALAFVLQVPASGRKRI